MSQAQSNKQMICRALESFPEGLDGVLSILAPEVLWHQYSPPGYYPTGGEHRGVEAVGAALRKLGAAYRPLEWKIVDAAADGDKVWTVLEIAYEDAAHDKRLDFRTALCWTMRDGQVVDMVEFFDTAGTLIQEGRIPAGDGRAYR